MLTRPLMNDFRSRWMEKVKKEINGGHHVAAHNEKKEMIFENLGLLIWFEF